MTAMPATESRSELATLTAEFESFSYCVSHDLRAPVRAVSGFARTLEEDYGSLLDDEGRRLLSVIQGEAGRLAAMIDDVLALNRLGRQPMVRAPLDMMQLVQGVALDAVRTAADPKPTIDVSELAPVPGDFDLLRVVWENLLENAIKFSRAQDEPHVRVWSVSEEFRVVYHVRDNGVGFDMQYASKLFGVFQKLHRGNDDAGTGIGLAQVQRILRRHGGSVWADARLGEGATFSFALPIGQRV